MRQDIETNAAVQPYQDDIVDRLQEIYDPEIGLDIYNLGLIYELEMNEEQHCVVTMTFTGVACACIETVPQEIVSALTEIEGIESAEVNTVWQPVWNMNRISRVGRITLGINPN